MHTGEKAYQCIQCKKDFAQNERPIKVILKRHMKTHIGDKLYQYTHCDKAFEHNYNLTKHLRTHTGYKPY